MKTTKKRPQKKKYPKYYCRKRGEDFVPFLDCFCVKCSASNEYFKVDFKGKLIEMPDSSYHRNRWKELIEIKHWVEIKPEELVLILGYLP